MRPEIIDVLQLYRRIRDRRQLDRVRAEMVDGGVLVAKKERSAAFLDHLWWLLK
jgi:hypothetical protein